MDFSLQSSHQITITSDKKLILLTPESAQIDGLSVSMPGEYEKSGFVMYVREHHDLWYYHFRIEGYWMGYIPVLPSELDGEILDFFGQLDVLIAPMGKKHQVLLEQIEPRMLVTYGEMACEMSTLLAYPCEPTTHYKLKAADISTEKTSLVILSHS